MSFRLRRPQVFGGHPDVGRHHETIWRERREHGSLRRRDRGRVLRCGSADKLGLQRQYLHRDLFSGGATASYSVGVPYINLAPSTDFQRLNETYLEFEPNWVNCDVDGPAVQAAIAIKPEIDTDGLSGTNQTEYGAILGDNGSGVQIGSIVQGQSYNQSNPPTTNLTASRNSIGVSNAQVVGIIHSHPPSCNNTIDVANRRPTANEWATADNLVAQGANPARLTLYIIDKNGIVRAYSYVPQSRRSASNPPAPEISTACQ